MLTADSIPVIVGRAILMELEKNLVFSKMFNKDYQGEVTYGGSVQIVSIGAVNVNPYTRYTPLAWQQVEDDSQTLNIEKAESVSIVIDDIDKVQALPDVFASYIRQAVIELRDVADQYLAGVLVDQADPIRTDLGTDELPLDISEANVAETLIRMARLLDDARVPRDGRVCIFPAWFLEDLVLASIAEISDNKAIAANGLIGRYAGFDLLLSHNCPSADTADEGGAGSADYIIAGCPISGTMAMQIEKSEIIRLESFFGDGYRGLNVYGARVTRPDTICILTADEAEES